MQEIMWHIAGRDSGEIRRIHERHKFISGRNDVGMRGSEGEVIRVGGAESLRNVQGMAAWSGYDVLRKKIII